MAFTFIWIQNFLNRKYPKDIRKALNAKYKSLHRHEKNIKNILKHSGCITILGHVFRYNYISPKNILRIKHHKYMINKIQKEINNIKNHYNGFNK